MGKRESGLLCFNCLSDVLYCGSQCSRSFSRSAVCDRGISWSYSLVFGPHRKCGSEGTKGCKIKLSDLQTTVMKLNPFQPNGISHPYQLDQSISVLRVVAWYFSVIFKF